MSMRILEASPEVGRDDWESHWRAYAGSVSRNPAEAMRFELVLGLLQLGGGIEAQVLDVGSGQGELLASVLETSPAARAVGIELSSAGVGFSSAKVPKARFLQRNLLETSDPPEGLERWATHAVCSEVLEHVDDPVALLRNASAYMAPGCRLVVTVPGGPMSAFDRHIGHRGHFTRQRLRSVLEDAGFRVDDVAAAGFPFFNLYRLLVVARGGRLIQDVADRGGSREMNQAGLLLMRLFRLLFRMNRRPGRLGWQMVAVAHLPQSSTASASRRPEAALTDGGICASADEHAVRIKGTKVPAVRLAWDLVPSAVRRPIVRFMRRETFRTSFLARLGIRDESAFLTLSNGGPEAIDLALDRLRDTGIIGNYYEFGVYRGYTLWYAQRAATRRNLMSMRFFGFDSFEGLPEVEGADAASAIFVSGDYRCGRQDVERMIGERGFDWSRAALIEGFFDTALTPDVKAAHDMGPAAIVMIDCDLYQSTVPVLAFIGDMLQDGTIMLFDDWYCFGEASDRGEPRAFREFLAARPEWTAKPIMTFGVYGRGFVMQRNNKPPLPS